MSKEAYYFSHDANARHDPKILALRSEFGIEGYGIYWVVVEMLREHDEFKLPLKTYIFNAIAMQVQSNAYAKEDAKQFVEFCINECDLFESDGDYFWSNSLLKRMNKKDALSKKRSEAAKARWEKLNDSKGSEKTDDANAMQMDANAMQTDARKGNIKEKKGNIKEKDNIPYSEIIDYLNAAAGTKYKASGKKTQSLIAARWNEKFGVEDFKQVIDKKVADANNPNDLFNGKYLRPETLFGTKFESYLNQLGGAPSEPDARNFKQATRTGGRQYSVEPPTIDWEQR
jgi:uncharacterized phage protein (TIGR02220 family)